MFAYSLQLFSCFNESLSVVTSLANKRVKVTIVINYQSHRVYSAGLYTGLPLGFAAGGKRLVVKKAILFPELLSIREKA